MLDHTPQEKTLQRQALRINPAKTCQPIGAMYAALGIHRCLPHSHGSQGCCAYHRSHLTRHFKEPVMAATSSFTEGASVFGGAPNLRQALKTIFQVYDPDIVAVHTTCLSETIGDDIPTIFKKAIEDKTVPEDKLVIHCNTPSYVGTHVTGYANMAAGIVHYLADPQMPGQDWINLVPGFVEPSDIRHLKCMLDMMQIPAIVFPDTSNVLDTPMTGNYQMYPSGGTSIQDLRASGGSRHTLALGAYASERSGKELEKKCKVPFSTLDTPIGVRATDRFVMAASEAAGVPVPESMDSERGKLLDMMTDYQHVLFGKKVALWGDPDLVIPTTEFLLDCGMEPVIALTGSPGKHFQRRMENILQGAEFSWNAKSNQDLFELHQLVKNHPVDLLLGNTYGKYISRAEDIPLVHFGFPVLDRVGHSHFPKVGYRGGMYLLSRIINTILDRLDRDSRDEELELVM